jgi:hypothetical protein
MTVDSNGDILISVRTDSRGFALKVKADGSQATGSTLTLSGSSPVYTSIISTATGNSELAYTNTISTTTTSSFAGRDTNPRFTMSTPGFYTPTITDISSTYAERLYITT